MQNYFHKEFFNDLKFFYDHYEKSVQFSPQNQIVNDKKEIFEQAVYCLLTPATKSNSAEQTYHNLFQDNFFYRATQEELAECLRMPPYIRFHNQKAERLVFWREKGQDIVKEFLELSIASEKREFIVKNVKGMNYKEATHYLRNIGQSGDLVILDRHILNFMVSVKLLEKWDPSQLSKKYFEWEEKFINFVKSKDWTKTFPDASIPRADFAIWASYVKKADPKLSYERILLLK